MLSLSLRIFQNYAAAGFEVLGRGRTRFLGMLRSSASASRAVGFLLQYKPSKIPHRTVTNDQGKENSGSGVGGSSVPAPLRSGLGASFRKGPGGRNSFSGHVVTVFGSTGFLGMSVINRFLKQGAQLIIPYRCDAYCLREHKVCAELGQILFIPFHLENEESIRKAVKHSNVVVNLIGTHYETPNFNYYDVNETGARRLARISREMGVDRFIHFSAMNACLEPEAHYVTGGSRFLRSKAKGELAVREEFPTATIIRPASIYGEEDKFLASYINQYRTTFLSSSVNMYKAGEETYKMPVCIYDVAFGTLKVLNDPSTAGQTFEFVGPYCYKLSEIVDYIYGKSSYKRHGVEYRRINGYGPWLTFKTNLSEYYEYFMRTPVYSNWEWFETVECTSDVLTGAPGLLDLGLPRLSEFEYYGDFFVRTYRALHLTYDTYHSSEIIQGVGMPQRSPPLYKTKKSTKTAVVESRVFGETRRAQTAF